MAEKFLDSADVQEVREAIKMTRLGKMLVEEGKAESIYKELKESK